MFTFPEISRRVVQVLSFSRLRWRWTPERFRASAGSTLVWPLLIVPPPVMRMTPIVNHVARSPSTERMVAPEIEVVPDAPVAVTLATRSEAFRVTVMSVSPFGARVPSLDFMPEPDQTQSRPGVGGQSSSESIGPHVWCGEMLSNGSFTLVR